MKEIKITCKGQKHLPIDQLKAFQGALKELSESEYEKLKRSILKYGFSFPVFVWQDFMLDGHQRIFTVNKLLQEGYTISDIPLVEIEAKDKTEAAEKLLVLNSHYAKITDEGLYGFINEMDVNFSNLVDNLELPDFDMDGFLEGYISTVDEIDPPDLPCGDKQPFQQMTFTLHDTQAEELNEAISKAKAEGGNRSAVNENSNGNAITFIAERFSRG